MKRVITTTVTIGQDTEEFNPKGCFEILFQNEGATAVEISPGGGTATPITLPGYGVGNGGERQYARLHLVVDPDYVDQTIYGVVFLKPDGVGSGGQDQKLKVLYRKVKQTRK